VTQTVASATPTVIGYTVTGTATAGSDYTALAGSVTIAAGATSATITVPVLDDNVAEADETVIVTLNTITSGDPQIQIDGTQNQATLQIADNEAVVRIVRANDGSETGPAVGRFTVTQSRVTQSNTVVAYTVAGTATSGSDYTALPGSVTIAAGQTSATITVPVLNDPTVEADETVIITLTNITSAPQAAGEIHTDFEKGFIRAEVIGFDDYLRYRGESGAKDAGRMRLEGKEYLVAEGDVMHFRFNV
jgi:hypothetical protein